MKDLDALIRSEHKRKQVDSAVRSFVDYMAELLPYQPPLRQLEPSEQTRAITRLDAELMGLLLESRLK